MPFLSVTLWLLNTDRVPQHWRNRWMSNVALALCTAAFAALAISQVMKAVGKVL